MVDLSFMDLTGYGTIYASIINYRLSARAASSSADPAPL